jgi:hypothetical protein
MAGQDVLVLNTHAAASDLLERRANIYSDRPRFIGTLLAVEDRKTHEMSFSGWRVIYRWISYCIGQSWRRVRGCLILPNSCYLLHLKQLAEDAPRLPCINE